MKQAGQDKSVRIERTGSWQGDSRKRASLIVRNEFIPRYGERNALSPRLFLSAQGRVLQSEGEIRSRTLKESSTLKCATTEVPLFVRPAHHQYFDPLYCGARHLHASLDHHPTRRLLHYIHVGSSKGLFQQSRLAELVIDPLGSFPSWRPPSQPGVWSQRNCKYHSASDF